ncbi:hypothetical protein BCV70DRAFT_112072, partial [Testicularia cyperi]
CRDSVQAYTTCHCCGRPQHIAPRSTSPAPRALTSNMILRSYFLFSLALLAVDIAIALPVGLIPDMLKVNLAMHSSELNIERLPNRKVTSEARQHVVDNQKFWRIGEELRNLWYAAFPGPENPLYDPLRGKLKEYKPGELVTVWVHRKQRDSLSFKGIYKIEDRLNIDLAYLYQQFKDVGIPQQEARAA